MGAADVVPGVSGGTVALVLGIYLRLVTAISHVDLTLLGYIRARQWRQAAAHIDLRFCLALGLGIGTGILALVRVMKFLLDEHPQPTLSVFFGLIAVSCLLVAQIVRRWTAPRIAMAIAGAVFAFWLTGLIETKVENVGYGYLFFSGVIAICAMILPGISGAFILVIMGMYHHVIGVVSEVAHGAITLDNLIFMAVFASGCVIGLLGFTKILRLLLTHYESATMAVLCGFMFGSLRKVWPFQTEGRLWPFQMEAGDPWPSALEILVSAVLAIVAAGAVLLVEVIARRAHPHPTTPVSSEQDPGDSSGPTSPRSREVIQL